MEQVKQVFPRGQAQQHVHIGKTQVGVDQRHPLVELGQTERQVDRKIGLADAALAGSDGKYQWECAAHLSAPCLLHISEPAFLSGRLAGNLAFEDKPPDQ